MGFFEFIVNCILQLVSNPAYATILFSALLIAVITITILRYKSPDLHYSTKLTYVHLIAVLTPLLLLPRYILSCSTISSLCMFLMSLSNFLLSVLVLILIFGYIILPLLYPIIYNARRVRHGHLFKKLKMLSSNLRIKQPRLFITDNSTPNAFSVSGLTPAVFVSIGLLELLNEKELEVVLLHELKHISDSTPNLRFLFRISKALSPLYWMINVNHILVLYEERADQLVLSAQHTSEHLNSAKRKLEIDSNL